ncbi:uncharacterized protein PRCAT00004904001 [Priceomyces carsonii]|uniref:uncharacterized protein n=1 Tax=Priceomyces carsonii TaxID=28549 RepID=UPI002EDA7C55|nr:unnamed protein product [Priceomyces carsonii]
MSWFRSVFSYEMLNILSSQKRWISSKNSIEGKLKWKILENEKLKEKEKPMWEKRQESLKKRYGVWNPTRRLSRQQIQDVRDLKDQMPHMKTIDLANLFRISPEAIRRVLKSKWVPSDKNEEDIIRRGQRRKLQNKSRKLEASADNSSARASRYTDKLKYESKSKRHESDKTRKGKNSAALKEKPYVNSIGDILD